MLDFFMVSTRPGKRSGTIEIYPRFIIKKSSDLMIRGGDFYAVWDEDKKLWSTEEDDVKRLIDRELDRYYEANKDTFNGSLVKIMYMWDAETGVIDRWHKYCQKQMRDNFHMLDEKIIFSNMSVTKKDYASKSLNYPLVDGEFPAYDKLMTTLYDPEEREKIEWAIGSIVSGDSKKIQKFLVLYGAAGTGKSTVLNIIQQLFDGYYSVFDAKSLGSANNQFALEAFKSNPLVAIQHDGDLSHIEDNTRLNSLVSHETMVINEKHKNLYSSSFKTFLFMGTNHPVRITDAKSGILRRLIDVSPSGRTLPVKEYRMVTKQIEFELGAIATHCYNVYMSNPNKYDDYIPTAMLGASNDFYNFVIDSYDVFFNSDGVTLKSAWSMYKEYCEDAKVYYPLSQRVFREELKNYFDTFEERVYLPDGSRVRNYYSGFKHDKFEMKKYPDGENQVTFQSGIIFKEQPSVFDIDGANWPAQYATPNETPAMAWDKVTTKLSDLDTSRLHYVLVPDNHIVIDFDIPGDDGNKCFERNLEEASKWPPTYAELSKSGAGIHLHYLYDGDVSKLSRIYSDHIEVKVFNGNSSLRRKLTKCNNLPIATISSGLPLQEEKKKVDGVKIRSQKKLFEMIERNLRKEIHGSTKPSCDFIYKIVEDAYNDGISYSIPDEMKERIMKFAKDSTHHSKDCVKLMKKLHWQSKDLENTMDNNNQKLREAIKKIYKDGELIPEDKIDRIFEILEDAYNSHIPYDLRDIHNALTYFATDCKGSETVAYCLSMVNRMHFSSEDPIESEPKDDGKPIVFYDIEVFPNLFLINWKLQGDGNPVVRMINPSSTEVEDLFNFRLIGFNCRRYDNHILYARFMGYDNEKLYKLSQKIIKGGRDCFFGEAYNLSYTDVYDFASAGNKKSLKKLEIEMGIHHQELGLPWDEPVPEDKWEMVAEYCDNDVIATEAAFNYLKADWTARQILADIAGMTVNDTTNTLTTKIIFGNNRKPQGDFNYRDYAKPVKSLDDDTMRFLCDIRPEMMSYQHGPARSLLPYWPGYKYDGGVSTYRGEEIGEGGYVWANVGIWYNVKTFDITSMHPTSMENECIFGPKYTKIFSDIKMARVYIKHEQWSKVDKILGGKLKPYTQKVRDGEMTAKELSNALKTAINSVYGLTAASFDNPFKDIRNKDNFVAKRGALFMVDLKYAVQELGGTVVHIKTDSIKIANPTPELEKFVLEFGKKYGYEFEVESEYERMCLVNDAVYVAKTKDGKWTATGTQFQVPYVFKKLFSKEPIEFDDLCETKSVSTALYLDMNENLSDDEHNYIFIGRVGQFCPIKPGYGGGILYREKDGKYYAATGTKGYRWLESELVRQMDSNLDAIDKSYYNKMVDDAIATISQYGDFEMFAK